MTYYLLAYLLLNKMNYIIYDLEATCWQYDFEARGKREEIIEIGALKINEKGEIIARFESFVQPSFDLELSDFCKSLTSISQEQVNEAPYFPEAVKGFKEWIGLGENTNYLLCSWGSFDKSALFNNCRMHGLESDWVKQYTNLKNQYPRIKRIGREMGLKRAVAAEGFEFEGIAHRAISDAENLAKIFIKYMPLWRGVV